MNFNSLLILSFTPKYVFFDSSLYCKSIIKVMKVNVLMNSVLSKSKNEVPSSISISKCIYLYLEYCNNATLCCFTSFPFIIGY